MPEGVIELLNVRQLAHFRNGGTGALYKSIQPTSRWLPVWTYRSACWVRCAMEPAEVIANRVASSCAHGSQVSYISATEEPLRMNAQVFQLPSIEDATDALIDILRGDLRNLGDNTYQLRLQKLCERYPARPGIPNTVEALTGVLLEATWGLCRMGVLRPGAAQEHFGDCGDMNGYAITTFGRTWLAEHEAPAYVPTDSGRITSILVSRQDLFGPTYVLRASEAARCYSAHA